MSILSRLIACALTAITIAGCGRDEQPAPQTPRAVTEAPEPYAGRPPLAFVCDSISAAKIFTAEHPGSDGAFMFRQYAREPGAKLEDERRLHFGEADAGMGSVYTPLLSDSNAEYGSVRWINDGMIDEPSAAYTRPLTQVKIGETLYDCRWLERTRIAGFSDLRSFVISEDADGDLIYRSYDFANPRARQRIDLDGVQRTTPFNVEVRGGAELVTPDQMTFEFSNQGYTYRIAAPANAPPTLNVLQGERTRQSEPILAFQIPPQGD